PGAPLHREGDVVAAGEPRQPRPQMLPVGRGDLAAFDLPGHGVEIVEGQLLSVDIQPAYDGHRNLLTLPRAPQAPKTRTANATNRDASELGRFLAGQAPATQPQTASQPMHVI